MSASSIATPTGLASGLGGQGLREVIAIIAVAVTVIGGGEFLLRFFEVPQYVLPTPSAIGSVFASAEMPTILQHYGYTLVELFAGYAIGASVGLVLAAVITQFPFVEKVITPYILLLVTTPMLALVPLLILNFGFGYTPRIIAVALASGPMVMINAATGFRRVDTMKISLARSYGASTLQIFTKIRIPMAMPNRPGRSRGRPRARSVKRLPKTRRTNNPATITSATGVSSLRRHSGPVVTE